MDPEKIVFSPENIAQELLDTNTNEFLNNCGIDLISFDNDNSYAFKFEALLTIFLEMTMTILKAEELKDGKTEFNPDYDKINFEPILSFVKDKMAIVGYISDVSIYEKSELTDSKSLLNGRYCRILLRNYNDEGDEFFNTSSLNYHMKLNQYVYKNKFKRLQDVYGIIIFTNKVMRIRFNKI
jgi:hypothetical protein